jgi:N-acetylglutamate synthase-like GNAT family acetyltransferase
MAIVRVASENDLKVLSRRLLELIADKDGEAYRENVSKFGIPDEYVTRAFSETAIVAASRSGNSTFYLALENDTIIGFAQTTKQQESIAELDRLIVFPKYARKGIGTQLLHETMIHQRSEGIQAIVVNAGKQEEQARRFYEKNGFKLTNETTVDAPWGKKLTLVTYQLDLE